LSAPQADRPRFGPSTTVPLHTLDRK
jgi:hypothetical protein